MLGKKKQRVELVGEASDLYNYSKLQIYLTRHTLLLLE